MLAKIKFGFLATLVIAFLASCGNSDSNVKDAARQSVTNPQPVSPSSSTATPAQPAAPVGPTTSITFDETTFEFGTITSGDKVEHTFTFTNTGKEPLIISNAKGSCGCTVPSWPRQPIAVGGKGEVKVVFNSKNKKGPRNQKVTLTANTDPPQSFIYLKGEVTPLADANKPKVNVN